ncbi:MAG TPA: type II toxin-antitoxin system RelE/ParE family toxin [Thermoanaerobaculia bacterium]|nr:type II toxin-antitoxin system RelE/ParE family toxin [Thermoanaerobaculia bacterium]
MKLRYRAAAKLDIHEARDWYGAISPALEERFAGAVATTLTIALDHPRAFPVVHRGDVRRAVVSGFPYQVFYRLRSSDLIVVAVTHSSRHPRSWQRRR